MALPLTKPSDGYLRLSFSGPAGVAGVAVQTWDLTQIPREARAVPGFDRSILVLARPLTAGLMDIDPVVAFVYDSDGIPTELVLTVTAGVVADEVALDVWCLHSVIGAVSDASKAYFIAPPGGGGAVTSVFGRVGAVVAVLNDYAASLVDNDSAVAGAQVSDALDTLLATIAALTSDDIANNSGVAGADVTDALNALAGATKYLWFEGDTNANQDGHRVQNIGPGGNFFFNVMLPPDFTSLVSLEMWGASRTATNAAASITATGRWGVAPAGPQANVDPAALVVSFTAGQLFQYSIAAAVTGLAANSQVGVEIQHNAIGGSIDYYGIMLGYT